METSAFGSPRHAANKALLASFFILGMGLFAPVASIWQSMDYLNAQFEAYYPSRLMSTGYNMMYMVLISALFRWGAGVWPSKHSRMLTGYLLYVAALATPPAVDQILLGYLQLDGSTAAVHGALACWATAAAVAGAADAMISSVIYAEAAAAGLKYTHALMAGKAASGVAMAVLRCISKLAMPPTKQGLQHSTGIYSAAAALLVLVCACIVAWVLPRMQQTMTELRQHSGVTVEQTLQEINLAVAKGHASNQASLIGPARRHTLATSSTCPTMSAASRHGSSEFSSPLDCQRQISQLPRNSYPPTTPRHGRSHRLRMSIPEGLIPHGAQYSLPEVMQLAMAHAQTQQHQQQEQGQGVGESQLQYKSGAGHPRSSLNSLQLEGSWELHIPAVLSTSTCGGTVVLNPLGSRTSSQSTFSCSRSSSYFGELRYCSSEYCVVGEVCALEQPAASSSSGSSDAKSSDTDAAIGPTAVHQLKHSPSASVEAAPQGDKQKQQRALPELRKKSIFVSSSNQPPSMWRAVKLVHPYQIAAFIPPLITATILPMCMSSQVGQSRALGSWYIQILVVAIQLGSFVGSALIPVSHPKYPRTTLLSAACAMVLFVAGFVIALRRGLFAVGFIPLAFVMQMYAGYLTTSVFCLAPHGLISTDAEIVQKLLVLTTSLSFAAGTSISWAWLAAGKIKCP